MKKSIDLTFYTDVEVTDADEMKKLLEEVEASEQEEARREVYTFCAVFFVIAVGIIAAAVVTFKTLKQRSAESDKACDKDTLEMRQPCNT